MRALLITFGLVLLTACQSSPVTIDYDTAANFSGLQRYAWFEKSSGADKGVDPLMAQRVRTAVSAELREAGLQQAPSADGAQVLVRYHVGSTEQVEEPKSRGSIGLGGGGGNTALGISLSIPLGSRTPVKTVDIVVDLLDPASRKLIWRGTYQLKVRDETPQEITAMVNQAVGDIFDRYPPSPEAQ